MVGKVVVEGGQEIKDEILLDLCETHAEFDESEYEMWFTNSYVESHDLESAKETIAKIFPAESSCQDILPNNLFQMIKQGEGLSIEWKNGVHTAEYSFYADENIFYTIYLQNIDGQWKIYQITELDSL